MVTGVLASLILTQTAPPAAGPRLELRDGFFVVTDSGRTTRVNSRVWAPPKATSFAVKEGNKTISWSWKGLRVQVGNKIRESRLNELPTSPRFFSSEQIAEFTAQLQRKEVTREVSALTGWERIGNMLYLVARWNDKDKKGWLEMLLRIDLSKPSPWFETVAASDMLSIATLPVEDQLLAWNGRLAMVAEQQSDWGFATWDTTTWESTFTTIGRYPRSVQMDLARNTLAFVERTAYGTRLAGTFNMLDGKRSDLAETRDNVSFPGELLDIVQVTSARGVVLRNAESGLELRLPSNVGVRSIEPGVLVWIPAQNPTQAVLYSKSGLRAISRWPQTPATPPAPRPGGTRPSR